MIKSESLVAYKDRVVGDDRGVVKPVLIANEDGSYKTLDRTRFPSGIYISKGYSSIDTSHEEGELFLIKEYHKDEQKTEDHGIDRYWAMGKDIVPLPANSFLPVIQCQLPPIETGVLPDSVKAPSGLFFILDESEHKVYGPVQASTVPGDSVQVVEAAATPKLSFGADYLGVFDTRELSESLIHLNINNQSCAFISSANELANHRHSTHDFMSDRKLIRHFNKLQFGKNAKTLSRKEAEKLSTSISDFERLRRAAHVKDERLERLKGILDRYLNESDIGYQIVKDYFDSTTGSRFLTQYVEENQKSLLGTQIQKITADVDRMETELKQKLNTIENQIKTKQDELTNVHGRVEKAKIESEKKIAEVNAEADEQIQKLMRAREESLQDEISAKEKSLEQKNTELEEICSRLGIANNIAEMERRDIFLQENNKRLEAAAKSYQDQLQNTDELSKRISEYHVIGRVLKGGNITQGPNIEFAPVDFASSIPANAADLVDKIRSHLDWDNGKTFSSAELSNLLISTTQSFLTVLAGPPGVGKTSTVVRLAKALQLGSPEDHKNFLYMPVSRGWVSGRDILGFYNSLNSTYQRARTGLYDFLNRNDGGARTLQMVLLDEANLSPMEHYWSDFLGMCDAEGRNRPIDTGMPDPDKRYLQVPQNVRFIATINHDSTTERLSSRLIDRVPVISIDHEVDIDYGFETEDLMLDGAIDYSLFEKFFKYQGDEAELSTIHKDMLDTLVTILSQRDAELGQSISISHRKRSAITNYCAAAVTNELMDPDTAFDFSVSQHILPHIEGYGSKFRNRIIKIQEVLGKNHPRSNKHLERILTSGNDFSGTYSFF
ncbi:AAA family ATPase [Pseudomonas aeruginosa]|uniref:AAA family ATPase n=1 Tax=Pseudomonas aeruginosa TaxID=287 RepID=UPI002499CA47|nr:AAA family ATPase [Pseudomonas aeruginosa]EIU3810961.1 AAA family ATPase [Pseudomonas aeruginosa]EIU3913613.1 AAA family ATPase [Pseudomonas aeruginosa]EIU3974182.1 AAA family ATPase [Pseudomonas aeruginosa]WGW31977.1 AAA family ATPase [Pseudomonas aeruginosa]WGW44543.1 AAA family ATPase [Pseudomonas aeruginosa]